MVKNRKLILFLISLAAIIVLSIFGKETAAIITLYGVYCTGNVASKFSVTTTRKEGWTLSHTKDVGLLCNIL